MLRRLFKVGPAEGKRAGGVPLRLGSGFAAHFVASYAVTLAVWAVAVARGAPAVQFVAWALMAPMTVPVWLFIVTPLVMAYEHTGRVSAQVLPGAPNAPVAAAGWVVYLGLFVVTYRGVHGRRVRAQRRACGLCLRCGYDVRATPGRCPGCGTAAATQA